MTHSLAREAQFHAGSDLFEIIPQQKKKKN